MSKTPDPSASSSTTDHESGQEGLTREQNNKRAREALKIMKERGLIDEDTYNKRLQDLESRP
jgi:uncharacterized membrane protein